MRRVCIRTRKTKKTDRSRINEMITEIKQHPAWREEISLIEIAGLLNDLAPYTFILSQGLGRHHYFLSYVSTEGTVYYKNIWIVFSRGDWVWKNGASDTYETINPLIPNSLGCSARKCLPIFP